VKQGLTAIEQARVPEDLLALPFAKRG